MNEDINVDIEYLTEKRDNELNHFNDLIKQYGLYNDELLHKRLDTLLRLCKHLKIAEDALMVYKIMKLHNE
jgi:hypothetical protein